MVLDSSDARDYHLVARDLKVNQPTDMNLFIIKAIEFVNVTQPKKRDRNEDNISEEDNV